MSPAAGAGGGVRVFAPASIGNLACGFDVLGLALDAPGDEVVGGATDEPRVRIAVVTGDDGRLPTEAQSNTAGVAAASVLDRVSGGGGLELELHKGLPLASGMGSSAASAVAGAVAADYVLGCRLSTRELLAAALDGEEVASKGRHADNVAPSLLGGFVLARGGDDEPEAIALPSPANLHAVLVHPHREIATADARAALPPAVPLRDAVAQWGNVGALVAALFLDDPELLGRALEDRVAEPHRAAAVPGFAAARHAASAAGALGFSLSGAGPSVFALCASRVVARRAASAIEDAFRGVGVESDSWVSPTATCGARLVERRR